MGDEFKDKKRGLSNLVRSIYVIGTLISGSSYLANGCSENRYLDKKNKPNTIKDKIEYEEKYNYYKNVSNISGISFFIFGIPWVRTLFREEKERKKKRRMYK